MFEGRTSMEYEVSLGFKLRTVRLMMNSIKFGTLDQANYYFQPGLQFVLS